MGVGAALVKFSSALAMVYWSTVPSLCRTLPIPFRALFKTPQVAHGGLNWHRNTVGYAQPGATSSMVVVASTPALTVLMLYSRLV